MNEFLLLVMCTANQCRSPMAEAIAAQQLEELGVRSIVRSCGVLSGGYEPAAGAVRAMKNRGLDISRHLSAQVNDESLQAANLIITMERRHLTEIAGHDLDAVARSFVLTELAELAPQVGYRGADTPVSEWVERANRFREPSTVLSYETGSDLPDPMGGSQRSFNRSAEQISRLLATIWRYLFPEFTRNADHGN